MPFDRLQYISQGKNTWNQLDNILAVLDAGCQWVQLRFKTENLSHFSQLAEKVKIACDKSKAVLIINDSVQIAKDIDAAGVHLGLTDHPVLEAREILGDAKIIGGTANTLQHVVQRIEEKCDYIGLGPFRFTTTKEKRSPVLGLEGYKRIQFALTPEQKKTPIYAIGGILADDLPALMETGIHGVAISGLISNEMNKRELLTKLNDQIYGRVKNS
jgi:thiamine-phosphate pyrophosphorylase